MTYQEIIDNLENGVNFSFSRFGDGEFNCMNGKKGANCDGHEYFPNLGEALNRAWSDPRGVVAVQRLARKQFKIEGAYPDADVIHRASIDGELKSLFTVFNQRLDDLILVGPTRLRIDGCRFIEVPLKNAWSDYERVKRELSATVFMGDVVLYCCGMMAEVLIWDFYSTKYTQIDLGSVLDPYAGVQSRTYHKKLKL
jgi:hypothetical protein